MCHGCVDDKCDCGEEVTGVFPCSSCCAIDVSYEGGGFDVIFSSLISIFDGGDEGKRIIFSWTGAVLFCSHIMSISRGIITWISLIDLKIE